RSYGTMWRICRLRCRADLILCDRLQALGGELSTRPGFRWSAGIDGGGQAREDALCRLSLPEIARKKGSTMLLTAIGFLLILAGTGLLGFGAWATVLSVRAGDVVVLLAGLNSWQGALSGLACYAAAGALFYLQRLRRASQTG